ncbi:MAG: hypothetical protein GC181_08580 [Bacteroidetes bacterium]|nr:hypothetical protein [Bacteroidota bacterium]
MIKIFTILLGIVFLGSCTVEDNGIKKSAVAFYGDGSYIKLNSMYATSDGGFVIGINTTSNRNQDVLVVKFNSQLKQEWQITLGGKGDEIIHDMLVMKSGEIIVACIANTDENKNPVNTTKGLLYLTALNTDGTIKWESYNDIDDKTLSAYTSNYQITDMVESEDQSILITTYDVFSFRPSIAVQAFFNVGAFLVVDNSGKTLHKHTNPMQPLSVIESDENYYIMTCDPNGDSDIKTISYPKNQPTGNNYQISNTLDFYLDLNNLSSSFLGLYSDHLHSGVLTTSLFFEDVIYTLKFDLAKNSTTETEVSMLNSPLRSVAQQNDDSYVVTTFDRRAHIFSSELAESRVLPIAFPATTACVLTSGEFIFANNDDGKKILFTKTTSDGKLVQE